MQKYLEVVGKEPQADSSVAEDTLKVEREQCPVKILAASEFCLGSISPSYVMSSTYLWKIS